MSAFIYGSNLGFYKTPISKCLLNGVLLTSCALHVPILSNYRRLLIFNSSDVIHRYKLLPLLLSKTAFYDIKDLLCGCFLLYYFRVFERRLGSHKFSSYLLASFSLSIMLEIITLYTLHYFNFAHIEFYANGPVNIIFSLFVNYFVDIPRVAQTQILGVPITGKSLAYLLALQMVITSNSNLVCAISGLLAGVICRYNLFHVCDAIKVPKVVASVANRLFGWLLESKPPQESHIQLGATLEIQRQQQIELMEQQMLFSRVRDINQRDGFGGIFRNRRQNDLNNPRPNVSFRNEATQQRILANDEQIQTLVEMGFDRQNVVRALQRSNNDMNLATTILLSES